MSKVIMSDVPPVSQGSTAPVSGSEHHSCARYLAAYTRHLEIARRKWAWLHEHGPADPAAIEAESARLAEAWRTTGTQARIRRAARERRP